jgi:hypothetical protein
VTKRKGASNWSAFGTAKEEEEEEGKKGLQDFIGVRVVHLKHDSDAICLPLL